jgi:hypothetical protein
MMREEKVQKLRMLSHMKLRRMRTKNHGMNEGKRKIFISLLYLGTICDDVDNDEVKKKLKNTFATDMNA